LGAEKKFGKDIKTSAFSASILKSVEGKSKSGG
jgi:hypothetical protein